MRHWPILFSLFVLTSCQQDSLEKKLTNRFVGRWLPVATYVAPEKVIQNLKPGWNPETDLPAVTFRADNTFFNPWGYVATTIPYQVLNEYELKFTLTNGNDVIYQYEFRNDTLVTLTNCTNQFYCGWKYLRQP